MKLESKFDVLRGWPREGAIEETFPAHKTAGVTDTLPPGTVVTLQSDGSMAKADTPTTVKPVWVVVEGTDDYSGTFTEKVVCLRSNAMFRLDPANFVAGSYTVGAAVSYGSTAGKWMLAAGAANQIIGEVIKDDRAVDGTLVVMYTAGTSVAS